MNLKGPETPEKLAAWQWLQRDWLDHAYMKERLGWGSARYYSVRSGRTALSQKMAQQILKVVSGIAVEVYQLTAGEWRRALK